MLMWLAECFIVALALLPGTYGFCPSGCDCHSVPNFINCHNAGLSAIPWNLPNPIGLKMLDMSGNVIQELLSQIVSYRNLEALDLSNCGIRKINFGVFSSVPNLKKLNLANNNIKLTKDVFVGLKSLEELDLSGNDISEIGEDTFADLEQLVDLNLAYNKVTLYPSAFVGLGSLQSLSLATNQLYALPTQVFQQVPNLITLNLAGNYISRLEKDSLHWFTVLRTLDLAENAIQTIEEETFQPIQKSLEYLSMRNNSLDRFPNIALKYAVSMLSLDLASNPFTVLDPDSLKGNAKLRELSLHSLPKIEVVRAYALSELVNLEKVHLHSNPRLHTIEKDAFLGSSNLKYIDLHDNVLQTLPEDLLPWSTIEKIDLAGNSWSCDCHFQFFTEHRKLLDLLGNDTFLCSSPPELSGLPVAAIESSRFICDVHIEKLQNEKFQDSIMIAIIAGICGILLIVLCVLMMQSRHSFFGNSYHMQVQYHDYQRPSSGRGVTVVANGTIPNGSVPAPSRVRRSSGRRLYRPGQVQRQPPALIAVKMPLKPQAYRPKPLACRPKPPAACRQTSLACIEEEEDRLCFAESEERLSEISGDNLV